MKQKIFDIAVFGGGVVGTAIFNKLTRLGVSCVLIEKGLDVALGATKANSGLVHAGFDAEENTLKAKLNVRGSRMFPSLCEELGIEYKQIGALVVGNDKVKLKALLLRGKKNGVSGLDIIGQNELQKLVPNINKNLLYALHAKTAGIVSPYKLAIALAEESVLNGGEVAFGFLAKSINQTKNGFNISDGKRRIFAKRVINSAGAGFNDVATLLKTEIYPITLKRGEYYVLDKNFGAFTNITVFPLPTEKGKGILGSPTIDGNYIFGPNSTTISNFSTETTSQGLNEVAQGARALFENPPIKGSIREYSGVRVSVGNDFIIEKSKLNENVVNVCGICSPGLSSAPAIAEEVAKLLGYNINKEQKMIRRQKTVKFSSLSSAEQQELISKNKDYGHIVCRCELVTMAEIKNAILSPLRPTTVDAIKRRVRAGMGRCQGSFCGLSVATTLADLNKVPINQINKESEESPVMPFPVFEKGAKK